MSRLQKIVRKPKGKFQATRIEVDTGKVGRGEQTNASTPNRKHSHRNKHYGAHIPAKTNYVLHHRATPTHRRRGRIAAKP